MKNWLKKTFSPALNFISRQLLRFTDWWMVVVFKKYSGRLLLFILVGTVIFQSFIPWTAANRFLFLIIFATVIFLISSRLAAMIALLLLATIPISYWLAEKVNLAETIAVYFYYLLWLVIIRQFLDLLLVHTKVGQYLASVGNRAEANIYLIGRWLLAKIKPQAIVRQGINFLVSVACRLIAFVLQNKVMVVILLILFLIPWFWFSHGEIDSGGDSARLYFYDPLSSLKSIALYQNSEGGFDFDNPNFYLIPFFLLLHLLKLIVVTPSALLSLFDSFLLLGAFLSVYGIIAELTASQKSKWGFKLAPLLGGLFFIFSQLITYNWYRYPFSFHQIAVYPLMFYLFLKYIKKDNFLYLIGGFLLTLIFAVNFSLASAPAFFAFFPAAFLFLLVYSILYKKVKFFFKGFFIFLLFFIFLHAFQLLPQIINFSDPASVFNKSLFTEQVKLDRGLVYFSGVRPAVRLIYNLVGFNQYYLYQQFGAGGVMLNLLNNYGVKFIYLFLIFPLVVSLGFIYLIRDRVAALKDRLVFITLLIIFLSLLFLMTANLFGAWGPAFYASLFYLPGFAMFRSFYGVFPTAFMFFYALIFGVALVYILRGIKKNYLKYPLVALILILLIYSAVPFITGQIANLPMGDTAGIKLSNKFKPAFEDSLKFFRDQAVDSKVLTLPLLHVDYQILAGEHGGAYVGSSPIGSLTGRGAFGGISAFNYPGSNFLTQEFVLEKLAARDYNALNRLFSLLNIGLIFNDSDPYIYRDNFSGWPYSREIFDLFPTINDFQKLIDNLGWQQVYQRDNYAVYYHPSYFLPRIFIPEKIIQVDNQEQLKATLFPKAAVGGSQEANEPPNLRTVIYSRDNGQSEILEKLPDNVSPVTVVEFKKINAIKYRLKIHKINSSFPLIFNGIWHQGWKLFPVKIVNRGCSVLAGDSATTQKQVMSAPTKAVQNWCSAGMISATGPDFISDIFAGTIQNQNLPDGHLWETWSLPPVDQKYQLLANGYTNSWWLDLDYLRKNFSGYLLDNGDGTYDLELVLEFAPQKYFYLGAVISSATLLLLLIYVLVKVVSSVRRYYRVE
ncbi:MAG: hypothetical protein WCT37_01365 [Patescibacteria group bacterium]|jgi:hypothetical protein